MKRLLFPVLSFLLIVFVLTNLDFDRLLQFFTRASWRFLALAFAFYLLTFVFRALRWKLVLNELPFSRLFSVVAIHTLANNIYPARTGELSFIYLLRELDKGRLFSVLLLARFMDIVCIGMIFSLSVAFLAMNRVYWLFFPLAVVVAAFLSFLLLFVERFIPETGVLVKVKSFLSSTRCAFFSLKPYVFPVFLASFLVWAIKYVAFYFLTLSIFTTFGVHISFWQAVFGVSFSELTTVLPIHSVGGYGTFEAGWTGAYILLGFDRKMAVTSGFLFHTLLLLFSLMVGLPFLVRYKFHK